MTSLEKITAIAESKIKVISGEYIHEEYWVTHYGANDIHPKNLVFWICVKSDVERDRLMSDKGIMKRLRSVLDEVDYPEEGRNQVIIGFESQETVDRESHGHWWHHWK